MWVKFLAQENNWSFLWGLGSELTPDRHSLMSTGWFKELILAWFTWISMHCRDSLLGASPLLVSLVSHSTHLFWRYCENKDFSPDRYSFFSAPVYFFFCELLFPHSSTYKINNKHKPLSVTITSIVCAWNLADQPFNAE